MQFLTNLNAYFSATNATKYLLYRIKKKKIVTSNLVLRTVSGIRQTVPDVRATTPIKMVSTAVGFSEAIFTLMKCKAQKYIPTPGMQRNNACENKKNSD